MSEKSARGKGRAYSERRQKLIESLWGKDIDDLAIWDRQEHKGFTTIPRTLPYIIRIMDSMSVKGSPLGATYLALWCRVFDEGFIEIKENKTLAYEAGFTGQRSAHTWTSRMRALKKLGFIDAKPGPQGEFQYVIVINPLRVIKDKYEGKEKNEAYNALSARMVDVGATWD